MVVPKGAIKKKPLEEVKSGSPSPEPFQEPEGMTTIDLNRTDDYSKECNEDNGKLRQRAQIRYVARLLACLCSILLLVMVVLISGAFLDREYQLFTLSTTTKPPPTSTTEDFISLTKQLNQALFKDRLKSGNYLDKSSIKMQRCQLKRTLEACCHVFKDTELNLLSDYCTVNDMLNILMEYDTEKRRKREIDYEDYLVDDPEGHGGESDYLLQSAPMFISPNNPMLQEEGLIYVEPHFEDDSPMVGNYLGAPLPDRVKQEVLHHVTLAPVGDVMPFAEFETQEREHPMFEAWREEQGFPSPHFDNFQNSDEPIFGNNVEFMEEGLNHPPPDTIFEETPEVIHSNFAHRKNAQRNRGLLTNEEIEVLPQHSPDNVDVIRRKVITNRGEDTALESYRKLPAYVSHLQFHSKGDEDIHQVGDEQKNPLEGVKVVSENLQANLNHHSESTADKMASHDPNQMELLANHFVDGEKTDGENVNYGPRNKFLTNQEYYGNFPVNVKPLELPSREVEDVPGGDKLVTKFEGVKVSENSQANSYDHSESKSIFQNQQVEDPQGEIVATKFDEENVSDGPAVDTVLTDFHKIGDVEVEKLEPLSTDKVNDEAPVSFQDSTTVDYNQHRKLTKKSRVPKLTKEFAVAFENVAERDKGSNLEQNEDLVAAIDNITPSQKTKETGRNEKDIEELLERVRGNHESFSNEEVQVGEPQHKKPLVSKFPDAKIIRINVTGGPDGVPSRVNPGKDSPQTVISPSTKRTGKQMWNPVGISDADISDELDETLQLNQSSLEELLVGASNLNNEGIKDSRAAPSQDDFSPKGKQLGALEDVQSTQQMLPNPCFYPYPSPYMPMMPNPSRIDPGYLKVLSSSQPRAQVLLNPAMFYSVPQPTSPSYMYPQLAQNVQPAAQAPLQVTSPGGQYYVCNPIPTPASNIAGMAQVEVRREATSLQDLLLESIDFDRSINHSRAAWEGIRCPIGEHQCLDNSKCIKNQHVCDNEVHCDDGSDEMGCSCKERMGKLRLCDGYCDCPRCEDEEACFGCAENEFSCDDWSRFRRSTCIPLEQRCDGVKQCEITGRDETDCSVLTDQLGNLTRNKISNSVGFLHRNYKGQWYPTCFGSELWAAEVCQVEAGPSSITPKTHMTLTAQNYDGKFINIRPNNEVSLVNGCVQDRAAFVECPPIYCGLRFVVHNPYRREEVDTSLEEMLNQMERAYSMREDDYLVAEKLGEILKETQNDDNLSRLKRRHTEGRIVGGKPSQPSAWPWLVSIYKNGIFHCAGVLINELWVITASHCVDRYWQYYYEIQAGTLRRFSYAPMDQRRWAKVVYSHELYDKENLRNDIALMKLSAPIRYNRHVRPICLPSESTAGVEFKKEPKTGAICTTVGWGATVERGSDPDQMREVEVPILGHCKHNEDSDLDEICAGFSEGGKDACQGDSGGPLMCRNPNNQNQWYLAGIVSHGQGCARPNEPGVYTRVSKYLPWIVEHTRGDRVTMAHPLQKCPGYICNGVHRCMSKKRRCDGTVDCFLGDDEFGCGGHNDIFKHSRSHLMRPLDEDDFDDLLGATRNSSLDLWDGFDGTNFRCKVLLQVVPMKKRCDKHLDCEDGSDEADCSCAHYVHSARPDAICDGVTDCNDVSDEIGCAGCTQSQFTCRLSMQCIDQSKRCDGTSDCPQNEDELNCVSLTNGKHLTVDKDNRPMLHVKGVVTVNHQGLWMPLCLNASTENSVIASSVCSVLGFQDYSGFYRYTVENASVDVTKSMTEGRVTLKGEAGKRCQHCCDGLFVSCFNKSVSSTLTYKNLEQSSELYLSPWTASIYSEGNFQCTGALLNPSWVITSVHCFGDDLTKYLGNHSYVTAVMGKGKLDLPVKGPHEQIAQVIRAVTIQKDVLLLKVDKEIKLNRYVQIADLNSRWEGDSREKCFAAGVGEKGVEFKALYPKTKCPRGYRCFDRKITEDCMENQQTWTGVVMCDSRVGWYPAAVFHNVFGRCGFSPDKSYTSVQFLKLEILDVVFGERSNASHIVMGAGHCNGFRCALGQCLNKQQECDGVQDCEDGSDESEELCYRKESECYQTNRCDCPATHFKCPKSEKCVPKSAFCDGHNDCGDYADEPTVCSCGNYLQLTNPKLVCDRVLNCADRTDEDPEVCQCKPDDFHCGSTNKCVPNDTICDGHPDCPGGEDEVHCLKLDSRNHTETNAGEVQTRVAGVWHSGCFNSTYTSNDLEKLCEKLGFPGTTGYQLSVRPNMTAVVPKRPVLDSFDVVWLNSAPKRHVKFLMRPGNRPYVSFVKDPTCLRLFVACV